MLTSNSKPHSLKPITVNTYSRNEEFANAISHGAGVIFGVAALVIMLKISENPLSKIASSIYGSSIILLFLSSTLYHSVTSNSKKAIMKTLDHCAIYLLIAGTYTPFMLISLENNGGLFYLSAIWSIAIIGILFKIFLGHRFPKISLTSYLAMGWFVLIAGKEMLESVSSDGIALLAIGGGCYTFGAIFYTWKKLHFNHAIWHLFVLAGAVVHFFSIYCHVLPVSTIIPIPMTGA